MATTTTATNACSAVVSVDSGAGVLTNVSGSSASASMTLNTELGEYKVFGDQWKYRLACAQDSEVSIDVIYTTTADEGFDILRDWWFDATGYATARTVRIDMPDSTAGSDRYTAEMLLESLSWDMPAGEAGPVMVSAALKPNGNMDHTEIGS